MVHLVSVAPTPATRGGLTWRCKGCAEQRRLALLAVCRRALDLDVMRVAFGRLAHLIRYEKAYGYPYECFAEIPWY